MSSQTLLYLVIGVAVLGLLIYRQLVARPVQGNQRLLLILVIIGVIEAVQYLQKLHAGPTAAAIAAIGSLILAAIFGAALAVSLAVQRVIVTIRAQRLDPVAVGRMGSGLF
jgi:hypothetical protein